MIFYKPLTQTGSVYDKSKSYPKTSSISMMIQGEIHTRTIIKKQETEVLDYQD